MKLKTDNFLKQQQKQQSQPLVTSHISFQTIRPCSYYKNNVIQCTCCWFRLIFFFFHFLLFFIILNIRNESKAKKITLVSSYISEELNNRTNKLKKLETKVEIMWVAFCFEYILERKIHENISRLSCVDITVERKNLVQKVPKRVWRRQQQRKCIDHKINSFNQCGPWTHKLKIENSTTTPIIMTVNVRPLVLQYSNWHIHRARAQQCLSQHKNKHEEYMTYNKAIEID